LKYLYTYTSHKIGDKKSQTNPGSSPVLPGFYILS
jgi:hypothetical protein